MRIVTLYASLNFVEWVDVLMVKYELHVVSFLDSSVISNNLLQRIAHACFSSAYGSRPACQIMYCLVSSPLKTVFARQNEKPWWKPENIWQWCTFCKHNRWWLMQCACVFKSETKRNHDQQALQEWYAVHQIPDFSSRLLTAHQNWWTTFSLPIWPDRCP